MAVMVGNEHCRAVEPGELLPPRDAAASVEIHYRPEHAADDPEEQRELFGEDFKEEYQEEARERWGDTEAWRQSQQRTSQYTKADWQAIKAEADGINARLVEALQAGEPAHSPAAMDAAEAHRQHITRWFYDCPAEMHANISEMYVSDPRFAKTYEDMAPGLAQYVRDAVHANVARQ